MSRETDDYLWDGYGKPDPEVEELENTLGSLRHKGDAPKLPSNGDVKSFYKFAPMLAIAASILIVIGAGLWLALHRQNQAQKADQVARVQPESGSRESAPGAGDSAAQTNASNQQASIKDHNVAVTFTAPKIRHYITVNPELQGLTPEEIREGRAAKARLMLAMQIASSKLNQAKKRVQEDGHPSRS